MSDRDYPRFCERHVFICANERPPGHPRGCCADRGAQEVRDRFLMLFLEHSLHGKVKVSKAGCLDLCELATVLVVYPEGVWYKGVRPEDVDEIFQEHILEGRPVERFRIAGEDLEWIRRCRGEMQILHPRPVPYEEDPR